MFIWFAGVLRARLAAAETEGHTLSTIAYAGAVAAAIFGIGTQADIGAAINASDVSAPTAGMFHHLGDLFFVGAELSLIVPMAAVTVLAFRTRAVPRWWGVFTALIAVVLWIGPIGWAALIFGTPLWVLGTTCCSSGRSDPAGRQRSRRRRSGSQAAGASRPLPPSRPEVVSAAEAHRPVHLARVEALLEQPLA